VRRDLARRAQLTLVAAVGAGGLACLVVLGIVVAWVVRLAVLRRPFVLRYEPPAAADPRFVVGAAAFFAFWAGLGLLRRGGLVGLPDFGFVPAAISLAVVGAVVAWVVLGARDRDAARRGVGWTHGRGVLREAAAAFAALPVHVVLLVLGATATVVLAKATGRSMESAAHPAFRSVADAPAGHVLGLLFHGAVAAPVGEETLFRGLLYDPLRGATAHWGRAASVLAAGSVQALLFAAMHPQGFVGMPVLAAIGFGLALVREWRGSLVAPIVLHGAWNGTILLLSALAG
jgi:membrane protease YdiL (CAAX protease family)